MAPQPEKGSLFARTPEE
jgi:hypothetical protein